MDILLLGSGGRECAIAESIAASPLCDVLYAAPGNGGIASLATIVDLDIEDGDAVADFASEKNCGLVVIGPEAPLVFGVADAVRERDIDCFGTGAEGARLEGSKEFSKEFMKRHSLPTAEYDSFDDINTALAYVREKGAPIVIKADGLAAGKGVTVALTLEEAEEAIKGCFYGRFGDAGSTVVIEEMLTGPECSLLAFADGMTVVPMAASQDHKRALEGDEGPNTGGMGVYSPVPIVTEEEHEAMVSIMEKAIEGLSSEEIDFKGVLYGGFMLTKEGPKLLEFNVRFGDPETQVVLPRLENDLVEVMLATARGELAGMELSWKPDWAVCVVLASGGYPGSYSTGYSIRGIEDARALPGVSVFHAGTKDADGEIQTAGGRVLNITALGSSFQEARDLAYQACELIDFEKKYLRYDIGARALKGRHAWEV